MSRAPFQHRPVSRLPSMVNRNSGAPSSLLACRAPAAEGETLMGSELMVALARATADGMTLFGHNSNRPREDGRPEAPSLVGTPARDHAPGEQVRATHITLPESRHTRAVLAG